MVTDETRARLLMAWVEELRAKYGSDAAIAASSGLDKSRISRWARGEGGGGITLANLVRLAAVSGHTLGDMLVGLYGVEPADLRVTAPTVIVEGSAWTVADDGRVVRATTLGKTYRLVLLFDESDRPDDRPDDDDPTPRA